MLPLIVKPLFGQIKVDGKKYKYDIVVEPDGSVRKRNKKLSKAVYRTSHKISLTEAVDIYRVGMPDLLICSGLFNRIKLSDEAAQFFQKRGVEVVILRTPKAIKYWNNSEESLVGLFHISC